MKLELNDRELRSFERLARDRFFLSFLERWLVSLKDFTTIQDLSDPEEALKIRLQVIEELEDNLLKRLKILGGKVEASNPDEFQ